MPAPIYNDYLSVIGPVSSTPPNAAEYMTGDLDPVFKTVWDGTKYSLPTRWQGDWALIATMGSLSYRYKTGNLNNVTLASISPTTGVHNAAFTITCSGTNFDPQSTIVFGGSDVGTNNLSNTSLTASIPGSMISAAGTYPVTVRGANGVVTAAQTFTAT